MSSLRASLLCLLIGLAGCSTAPHLDADRAPDWHAAEGQLPVPVETVNESPNVALPRDDASTTARPTIRYAADTWIPLARWAREHQAGAVARVSVPPLDAFSLTSARGVLVLQARSLVATWNGVGLRLGFEPQLIDNQPFIHALDLAKNILPLLNGSTPSGNTVPIVVLDPGHGGSTSGTRSVLDASEEKVYTLDWARRIAPLLSARGWKVLLTRADDSDVSLTDRVALAEQHGADFFISLHFNSAAPSQEQSGLEIFCLTPAGMPSTLTRGYEDNVALVFPNNSFDAGNLQLAMHLQRTLLKRGGFVDRGVRRARFLTVLRGQNRPAVLIEAGFLSNPAEARRIAAPAFRQTLAEAVATALVELWGAGDAAAVARDRTPPGSAPASSVSPTGTPNAYPPAPLAPLH